MNVFGLTIARTKTLMPVDNRGGWVTLIREAWAGAWQQNVEVRADTVLAHNAVYACISLIATDVAKMRCRLVEQDKDGIWTEIENAAHSPVLRRPNRYQNRIQFITSWLVSKLVHGNAYILKERDERNVVRAMYVLDPLRTRPVVADDGSVFYMLNADNLTGITETESAIPVPAKEIIHDVCVPLFHPLVGVSPIYACGMAALQGLKIEEHSTKFFSNGAKPSGILMVPGAIKKDQADKLREQWEANYSGDKMGGLAVLADGMKYLPQMMSAVDSQLIDLLRWAEENVCSTFHVPIYKINSAKAPNFNSVEALDQQYYSQCLQAHIESIELLLDEGLELPKGYGTEFDLDDLMRMDTLSMVKSEKEAGGLKTVNESRKRLGLKGVNGGDTVFRQQQDFSLEALNRRDSQEPLPPVGGAAAASAVHSDGDEEDDVESEEEQAKALVTAGVLMATKGDALAAWNEAGLR